MTKEVPSMSIYQYILWLLYICRDIKEIVYGILTLYIMYVYV